MKQHREPFLFWALEKYFQPDFAHHYKNTAWQPELQEVQSPISSTTGGTGSKSLHGSQGATQYLSRHLQTPPQLPRSSSTIKWAALPFSLIQPGRKSPKVPNQGWLSPRQCKGIQALICLSPFMQVWLKKRTDPQSAWESALKTRVPHPAPRAAALC